MPKPWKEVAASPQYLALAPEQREAARAQYFEQVVAPQVDPAQVATVRAQFDQATGPQAAPKPDFSGVKGDFHARQPERLVDALPGYGVSRVIAEGAEDFARAAGHHAMKPLHGAAQAVEHGVGWLADQVLPDETRNISGLITGKKAEPTSIGGRLHRYIDDTIAADDEALRQNERAYQATIADTAAADAGAVVGTVAPFLLSGGRLGGAKVGNILRAALPQGAKFLPRVAAGVTEGAIGAASTPVLGDDFAGEKTEQLGVGALIGGALPVVGSVLGKLKPLADYAGRFTKGGAQQRALEQIQREATDFEGLKTARPSEVDGVNLTLAQESLDPGVARLEGYGRKLDKTGFETIDRNNNEARVAALKTFAGDEADIAAAEAARDAAAKPLRDAALKGVGVDTSKLVSQIDKGIEKLRGMPDVQRALADARGLLFRPATAAEKAASPNWPDMVPEDEVAVLYNVRKTINHWIGKADPSKPYLANAQRELIGVRDALDRSIKKSSPEFGQYLDTYKAGSRPVNRLALGAEILKRATGGSDDIAFAQTGDVIGTPRLLAGKMGNVSKNLDAAAKAANPGFKKAKAAAILEPGDMATLRAVKADLDRVAQTQRDSSGGNSITKPLEMIEERAQSAAEKLPLGIGKTVEFLNAITEPRIRQQLVYLLQNPAEFRRVAATMPAADAATLADVLARLAPAAGAAATRANDQQVDAEVVGGTPMPRDQVAGNIAKYAR